MKKSVKFYRVQRYLLPNAYYEYFFIDYRKAIAFAEASQQSGYYYKIRVNSIAAKRKKDVAAFEKLCKQGVFEYNKLIVKG